MAKTPIFWGTWEASLDENRRIVIPTDIVKELRRVGVEELLCIPDGEYVKVCLWKKIEEVSEEKMKDVWRATICKSKPRITLLPKIRSSLFSNCDTVVIECWKDYFRIIPLRR